jgi:hypothetical protein
MRRVILSYFLIAVLFSGCAYEGVIVEKRFRPLPFPDSLGVDAMYNFQLRDSVGQIHSQMVTAEVFASYRVGDHFNDLQLPPSREDKEMKGFAPAPGEISDGPYQPVRVMQFQPPLPQTANVALALIILQSTNQKSRTHTIAPSPLRKSPKATILKRGSQQLQER